jgi:trimeric autotransporter adhesin
MNFRKIASAITALVAAAAGLTVATPGSASAVEPGVDGLSSLTAAASCWEIKQRNASAPDGIYWLVTPTLVAPEQFYCDMTTDGGGWVLIGRGREGWVPQYEGKGTAAQVRDIVTGPAAFVARQLSSRTIDGLLDGRRVDGLADGVRIRRALNASGSNWQEVRFSFASRTRWVWTLAAEHGVATWEFGSNRGTGGETNYLGSGSATSRLDTRINSAQGWVRGMAYGSSTTGTASATSYLWSQTTGQGSAVPFAQVYLRPKLRRADLNFAAIPDSGTPKQELSPLLENGAQPNPWGVTGLANGLNTELTTEVSAFTQVGNTVYVGGNFQFVQKGPDATGDDKVEQSYLAAFDAVTGDWIPSFRPVLNGQVKALAALPTGAIVAGGEFTTANGSPAYSAVALDGVTGADAPGWNLKLENRSTSGVLSVRAMKVSGNWLYLGGGFTHLTGGTRTTAVYARNAARVRLSDGLPDSTWNPLLNGTVVALDVDASGSKVYAAGYFSTASSLPAFRAVELSATSALPTTAWAPEWSSTKANYQQAIVKIGNKVFVGGSEHGLFSWDTNSWARTSGTVAKQGGDFQTMGVRGNLVFSSCHCNDFVYTDAYTWNNVGTSWTQADKIGYVGAWDATTGKFIPDFDPVLDARRGSGGWANITDATGVTWFGGDFIKAKLITGANGWAGGFVRFAMRDTTAPPTPTAVQIDSNTAAGVRLTWGSSGTHAHYEVIRENRVVTTTAITSVDLPAEAGPTRYFVRAIDSEGNRSASSSVLVVEAPPAPTAPAVPLVTATPISGTSLQLSWPADGAVASYRIVRDGTPLTTVSAPAVSFTDTGLSPLTTYSYAVYAMGTNGLESAAGTVDPQTPLPLVTNGSTWRWTFTPGAWSDNWATVGYDDSGWAQGSAVLGFGSGSVVTNIDVPLPTSNRPVSAQFRRTFEVADPSVLSGVSLRVKADDGVIVFVNGVEVGRENLPTGTITHATYALTGPRTSAAPTVLFQVPVSLLNAGTNVVAVSTHLGWRATPDVSFDLSMTGV